MPTNAKIRQGNNQESVNNMEQRATSTLLSQLDNGFLCENFPFCKTFKKKFNTSLTNESVWLWSSFI